MRNPANFAKQVNEFLTKSWAAVNNEKGRIIPSVIKVLYLIFPYVKNSDTVHRDSSI